MFKKILYLILLPSVLFSADYFFYVNSPEEVDSYNNIFQAFASIFHDESYGGLLRLAFLFGGFIVFVKGIFDALSSGEATAALKDYTKYLISIVILLTIIFSFEATVIIKTNNLPDYCSPGNSSATTGVVVDNVPELLAYSFSTINRISRELTRLIEQNFIIPSGNGSTSLLDNHGYVGSIKSAMQLMTVNLSSITLTNSQSSQPIDLGSLTRVLFTDCMLIPFSSKGDEGLSEINKIKVAKDLKLYIDDLYISNRTIGGIAARDYTAELQGNIMSCGTLYDYMQTGFQTFENNSTCAFPGVGAGAIQLITGQINPPESTFKEVTIQSGLISELEKAEKDVSLGVKGVGYNTGKSKAEFLQTQLAKGAFTAEMLPFLQSVIRGLIYAFFPFTFVIILLPGGFGVLGQYLKSILWVELWTPTAAVLNMFINSQAQYQISGLYTKHGMTLMNSVDMLSSGSTIAGVAGYLYASVPAITWMIVSGSGGMLSSLGHGIAEFAAKNIKSEESLKDTELLSQKKQMANAGIKNEKNGEEFSLSEMQRFSANNDANKEASIFAVEDKSTTNTIAGQAGVKRAEELESFKQKAEYFGLNGTDSKSLTTMGGAYASSASFQDGIKMKTMQGLDKQILTGAMNTEVNKGSAILQTAAIANKNGLSQDEFIASETKKYQENYSDKAYMNTQRNAHKEILDKIDKKVFERTGKHLTEDEKDFMAAARGGQSLGKYDAMESIEQEQFIDLITGKTANTIDDSLTGQKVMGADSDAALFSYGLRQGTSAKFDSDVNLLKNEELANDNVGPAKVAHAQAAETEIGIGAIKGKEVVAKGLQGDSGSKGLIRQGREDNQEGTINQGTHSTKIGVTKKGKRTFTEHKTGETWKGDGYNLMQKTIENLEKEKDILTKSDNSKEKSSPKERAREIMKDIFTITEVLKFLPISELSQIGAAFVKGAKATKNYIADKKDSDMDKKATDEAHKMIKAKYDESIIKEKHLINQKEDIINVFKEEKEKINNQKQEAEKRIQERIDAANIADEKAREKFMYEKSEVDRLNNEIKIYDKKGLDATDLKLQLNTHSQLLEQAILETKIDRVKSVQALEEHNKIFFDAKEKELLDREKQQLDEINKQIEENKKIMDENKSLEDKLADADNAYKAEQDRIKNYNQIEVIKNQKIKEIEDLSKKIPLLEGQAKLDAENKLKTLQKVLVDLNENQAKFAYKGKEALDIANNNLSKLERERASVSREIDKINNSRTVFHNGEKISIENATRDAQLIKEEAEHIKNVAHQNKENTTNRVNQNINAAKSSLDSTEHKMDEVRKQIQHIQANNNGLANGNLSEINNKLSSVNKEIEKLQKTEDILSPTEQEKLKDLIEEKEKLINTKTLKELTSESEKLNKEHLSQSKKIEDLEYRNISSKNLSKEERASLIEESKSIKAEKFANKNADNLVKKADELERKIENAEHKFQEKEGQLNNLIEREKELNSEIKNLNNMSDAEKIEKFQQDAISKGIDDDLKEINKELQNQDKLERALQEDQIAKKERASLKPSERQDLKDVRLNEKKIGELSDDINKLNKQLEAVSSKGVSKDGVSSSADIKTVSADLKYTKEDIKHTQDKLVDLNIQKMDIENQIRENQLKIETFGNSLSDDLRNKEAILNTVKNQEFMLNQRKESIEKEIHNNDFSRQAELNEINKQLNEISKLHEDFNNAKEKLEKFNEDPMSSKEYAELKDKEKFLEEDLKKNTFENDFHKEKLNDFEVKAEKLSEIGFSSEELKKEEEQKLKDEISKKEKSLNELKTETDKLKNSKATRMINSSKSSLSDNLESQIKTRDELLEKRGSFEQDLTNDIKNLNTELNIKEDDVNRLKEQLDDFHKNTTNSDYDIEKEKKLNLELDAKINELNKIHDDLVHKVSELDSFKTNPESSNEFKQLEKDIDSLNNKIERTSLRLDVTESISKEGRVSLSLDKVDTLNSEILELTKEKVLIDETLKNQNNELKELEAERKATLDSDTKKELNEKIKNIKGEIKDTKKELKDVTSNISKKNGVLSTQQAKVRNTLSNKVESLTPNSQLMKDMKTIEKGQAQDLYESKKGVNELERELNNEYTKKGLEIPVDEQARLQDLKTEVLAKEEILENTKNKNKIKREHLSEKNSGDSKQVQKSKQVDKDMKPEFKNVNAKKADLTKSAGKIQSAEENRQKAQNKGKSTVSTEKKAAKASHQAKVAAVQSKHATIVAQEKRAAAQRLADKETGFFERMWNKTNIDTKKLKGVFKGGIVGVAAVAVEYTAGKLNTVEGKALTSAATLVSAPFVTIIELGVSGVKGNFYAAGAAYASLRGDEKLKTQMIKELDIVGKEITSFKAFNDGADAVNKSIDLLNESYKLSLEGKYTSLDDLKKAGNEVASDLNKAATVVSEVSSYAYDHVTLDGTKKAIEATAKFVVSDHVNPWAASVKLKENMPEIKEKTKEKITKIVIEEKTKDLS